MTRRTSPFDELRQIAAAYGVPLLHAYLRAGLADSTYYRHRDGRYCMKLATHRRLLDALDALRLDARRRTAA